MKDGYFIFTGDVSVSYTLTESRPEPIEGDHCHEKYEIIYLASASGSYTIEGAEYIISPGVLMLINPFAYHRVEINADGEYEAWSILFPKNVLPGRVLCMLERLIDDGENSGCFYSTAQIDANLISVFKRFSIAQTLPEEEKKAYIETLLSEIIIFLSVMEGESITHNEDSLGARVMRYLNNNIENNISLDKLARRFFVSKYHLCRAFKEYSGISVHSYINHKRIMYAKQLIESGETASGAAERVGFGDYSAFYRAYFKIVGRSPTSD